MSIDDDLFFSENITSVNRIVEKLLFSMNCVGPICIIGRLFSVFSIPYAASIQLLFVSIPLFVIEVLLNRNSNTQKISMYYGLIATTFFICYLNVSRNTMLYMTFAFIPLESALYYNKKLLNITTIISYCTMCFSIFLIYESGEGNGLLHDSLLLTLIDLSIEFAFLYIIALALVKRSFKTLEHLINSIAERNKVYEEMQKQNTIVNDAKAHMEAKNIELHDAQFKIIQFVAQVLGSHDLFTGHHVMHTRKYVGIIAKQLRENGFYTEELTDSTIEMMQTAAFLHDIGKVHIPEGVLNKIGKFTPEEFELMKCHPDEGRKLLEYLPQIEDGEFNKLAKEMAYCHHEKWDGSGYPNKISGLDIPLSARIMAAADVLDALISQRLYKQAMTVDEAMVVFEDSKNSHFEECIAQAVIDARKMIFFIDQDFKTSEASTDKSELEWWQRYYDNIKFN